MAELTREELLRGTQASSEREVSQMLNTALNKGFLLQETRTLYPEEIPAFNSSQQYSCGSEDLE